MNIREVAQEIEALGVSLAGRDEAMSPENVHRLRHALRRWHGSLTALTNDKQPAAPRDIVGEVRPGGFRGDVQETPWGWQVVLRSPGRVPWDIEDAQALLGALDLPQGATRGTVDADEAWAVIDRGTLMVQENEHGNIEILMDREEHDALLAILAGAPVGYSKADLREASDG